MLCLAFCVSMTAKGQESDKPEGQGTRVSRSTLFSVGSMNRLDTYLSPLEYKGTDVRFVSSVLRERKCRWDIQFTHEGEFDYTSNPADNADALAAHYDFAFSLMRRWELMDGRLVLRGGGMTDLMLGFAYNMHNTSNNPAQGYASLAIGGAGSAAYTFNLWNRAFTVGYEARVPLVGLMFSPNYGQSYYEIFSRGDYDHNVVVTSVATPSIRQMLTVSTAIGKRTLLTLGYLGDVRQAKPNNIKQHTYTHAFVAGFTKRI